MFVLGKALPSQAVNRIKKNGSEVYGVYTYPNTSNKKTFVFDYELMETFQVLCFMKQNMICVLHRDYIQTYVAVDFPR